jgi:hypothetical protein
MQGTLAGTDSWFRNPKAQASAHFGTGKDGTLYQWVDTASKAWAQEAGNSVAISVENEGDSGQSLTPQQVATLGKLLAWCHAEYGIPLAITNDPVKGSGLGWHGMGGVAWGDHLSCPGAPIEAQRAAIIAAAKGGTASIVTWTTAGLGNLLDLASGQGVTPAEIIQGTAQHATAAQWAPFAAYLNAANFSKIIPKGISLFWVKPA